MKRENETRDMLGWYYYRISSMSIPEIAYRLRWKLRQSLFYRLESLANVQEKVHLAADDRKLSKRELLERFRKQEYNFASLNFANKKNYSELFSEKRFLELADNYCGKSFSVYQFKNVSRKTKKGGVDWLTDFKSKKKWPMCFEGDIYHNTKKMSIRYLWELNSMLHLYTLGKAYFITRNEKYAREAIGHILSWIEQNPYLYGPNWFSSLEQGIRIISWSWALNFIRDSRALDENNFELITKYIYLKAEYIYRNLSLYSSANNHLIGELAGLAVAGSCFPWLKHAKKWQDKAYPVLYAELSRQFHTDGVPAEQAMNYAMFTMDFYLQSYLASGTLTGMTGKLPDKFLKYIDKLAEFIINMMDSKGNMPDIGDSDEARVTELNLPRFFDEKAGNNYLSFLNTAAILLDKPEYLLHSKVLDEKTYWLLGKEAVKKYNLLNKKLKQKLKQKKHALAESKVFREGGYTVLRNHGSCVKSKPKPYSLIFDHGPLGYLSICAHGHADALSVLLNVNGKEFLTDPGTYVYHEGMQWRDYFRSTQAHNTIKIDGLNQSEIRGVSIWGRKANARLLSFRDNANEAVTEATHDGYKRLPKLVTHTRKIVHNKKAAVFEITDTLKGKKGRHKIELCFNLHPDVKIKKGEKKRNENELTLLRGTDKVSLALDPRLKLKLFKGSTNPISGWYSPSFGVKVPAYALRAELSADIRNELKIRTRISILS